MRADDYEPECEAPDCETVLGLVPVRREIRTVHWSWWVCPEHIDWANQQADQETAR